MHYLTKIIRFIYTRLFYIQYNQLFINCLSIIYIYLNFVELYKISTLR